MSMFKSKPGLLLGLPGKTGDKIAMKDPAIKKVIGKPDPKPAPVAPVAAPKITDTILTSSGEALSESQKKSYLGGY
jgi:hypothetical protein